jgi:hypothetical protein
VKQTPKVEPEPDVRPDGLPVLLKTAEVAELLQVDASTLCRWRQAGVGPRPTWLTRSMPRYQRREVMAWLERMAS